MNKSCLLLLALLPLSAHADSDDLRRLSEENGRVQQQYRESGWLDGGTPSDDIENDDAYIRIGGQIYTVGNNTEELESAIYHAINERQWKKAERFATRYAALPNHNQALPKLVLGLKQRAEGRLAEALRNLQAAEALDPANPRILLETARLYTEDNQNREARSAFARAQAADIPEETRALIGQYLGEIDKRSRWHGQIGIAYGYNSNINQSDGSVRCILPLDGQCLAYQNLPDPIRSPVWNYSLSAGKITPIKGHHSLKTNLLAYGTHYRRKDTDAALFDYGSQTGTLSAGYEYADAQSRFSLMPIYEHERRNRHTYYNAYGAETSWTHTINPKWQVNADWSGKRYRHSGTAKTYAADYTEYRTGLGAEYALTPKTGVFAGSDYTRRTYNGGTSDHREYTLRTGLYTLFDNGTYLNALVMKRRNLYDRAGIAADGQRRSDRQTVWLAAAGFRQWHIGGFYPELRFKHTTVKSNSVFYRYRQNEIMLGVKKQF